MLPEEVSLDSSLMLCRRLNATVAVPASPLENQLLLDEILPFKDVCDATGHWKAWLGITDAQEEGTWRALHSNQEVNYSNFPYNGAGGSAVLNCAAVKTDGFWAFQECSVKRCTACRLHRLRSLRLRGLCFDEPLEAQFRLAGYLGGRPLFRGFTNKVILWDKAAERWTLVNAGTNATIMSCLSVPFELYPLGKHKWEMAKDMCGNKAGDTILASLSACTSDQFMCNVGDCIQTHQRCNYRFDCDDHSDEINCSVVGALDKVQRAMPPKDSLGGVLLVTPAVTINIISEVDDINMAITLEFMFSLAWNDNRLKFKHLTSAPRGTVLAKGDSEKIWLPKYQVTNVVAGNLLSLTESFAVRSAAGATAPGFNDVDMGGCWTLPLSISKLLGNNG